ncbi:hypothetical protein F4802DRAFT_5273 [Xylaria palmicola]|nr:hypothetical protein F4802DRAFT_5273 [Xylaria palmicola]
MTSIGPTLPPHLAKRKRTSDDDTPPDSPPTKIRASESAHASKDEIEPESDSDDEYGPSAAGPTTRPSIGPSLPPSIGPTPPPATSAGPSLPPRKASEVASGRKGKKSIGPSAAPTIRPSIGPTAPSANTDEIPLDDEDDDEDDVGPAPPEPKRVHGPAPPPAALSERPAAPANSDSDDDSDDDYGPALPSSNSHQQRQARALEAAEAEAATSKAPQRDDWMLAPPTAGGYRAADPTKLKARRFNSGPRANASGGGDGEISSIWTETPEEKRRRLENAVLGRDTGAAGPNAAPRAPNGHPRRPAPGGEDAAQEQEQAARIRSYTEATRGRSLYEEHQAARAAGPGPGASTPSSSSAKKSWVDEEEDDPSKRAFDKEKDMKLGGRIGASQRRELLNKAADFGGRFAKGKYL